MVIVRRYVGNNGNGLEQVDGIRNTDEYNYSFTMLCEMLRFQFAH